MAENVEGWGGFIKTLSELKPRYLFVFWFPCALLIFAPATLLERLGFSGFVEQYRGWIGVIALVFFVLWVVQLYSTFNNSWKKRRENKQSEKDFEDYKKSVIKYLYNNSLSTGESFLITYALHKKQQVVFAAFTNPLAQTLVRKGLLTVSGSGDANNFPFMIPDFIWEHLQENENKILPQTAEDKAKFMQTISDYEHSPRWLKDTMFQ